MALLPVAISVFITLLGYILLGLALFIEILSNLLDKTKEYKKTRNFIFNVFIWVFGIAVLIPIIGFFDK